MNWFTCFSYHNALSPNVVKCVLFISEFAFWMGQVLFSMSRYLIVQAKIETGSPDYFTLIVYTTYIQWFSSR